MILLDDLLVKPFIGLLDTLRTTALNELYDVDAIRDDIKENQLLYEIGERPREEYERRREELEAELAAAERIRAEIGDRVEVKR